MMKPPSLFSILALRALTRPAVFLCASLLLPLLLLPLGCKKAEETPAPEVAVQAAHPVQGSIHEQIAADAILAPLAQAAISPKVSAPVKKFYVQRGSQVHEGELLATLENSDLAAAALDNQGSYTAAQATFDTATKATAPDGPDQGAARSGPGEGQSRPRPVHRHGAQPALQPGSDSRPRPGHREGGAGGIAGHLRHRQGAF